MSPSIQPGQPLFSPTREWLLDAAVRIEKAEHKWSQGFTAPMLRLTADAMTLTPVRIADAITAIVLNDQQTGRNSAILSLLEIREALDAALDCYTKDQIAEAISAKEEARTAKGPT